MTSPVRDGSNAAGTSHSGGTTGTISVTCSAGAIVVLAIQSDITTSSTPHTNSMAGDTSGLVWTHVGSAGQANAGGTSNTYSLTDVWVGKATGALVAATVTVTASTTIDDWAIIYSSYTGQAASPLDPHAGLPVTQVTGSTSAPQDVTGLNTTNAADMLIFVWGSAFASSVVIGTFVPTGTTVAASGGTSGGTHFAQCLIADVSVSTVQTALTIGGSNSSTGFQTLGFALTASGSGPTYVASQFLFGG